MDASQKAELLDLIRRDLASTPRALRLWCGLGALLCGGGLALRAAVWMDGGATLDDVGPPLVLFFIFGGLGLLGVALSHRNLRALPQHPLVIALTSAPQSVRARHASVNRWPALLFELQGGQRYFVAMAERTRAETMAWLAREGSDVG